jgi:hypothetical protein
MKYWLIFMIFTHDGEFIDKIEYPIASMKQCKELAGHAAMESVNKDYLTQYWCVTDDHYRGRKQDPGIPLD